MVTTQNQTLFETLNSILEYWQLLENILAKNFDFLLQKFFTHRQSRLNDYEIYETVKQFISLSETQLEQPLVGYLSSDSAAYFKLMQDSLQNKIERMLHLEQKKGQLSDLDIQNNLEAALKASFYYYMRHLYNYSTKFGLQDGQRAAIFFFVRENAYASMFRFNKNGDFNIPYGGISYNRKNLKAKVEKLRDPRLCLRLANTTFGNIDFADFLTLHSPAASDFIFLDPSYDSDFSNYDKSPFGQADQERLANFLINGCTANFMLVIKSTPFILSLYDHPKLNTNSFDKKYMYTVKERNNRDVTHLFITNY